MALGVGEHYASAIFGLFSPRLLQVYGGRFPLGALVITVSGAAAGHRSRDARLEAISHPPSPTATQGGIPSSPTSCTHHHTFIFKYILSTDFAEQLSWEVPVMLRNKFKDIVLPAREREKTTNQSEACCRVLSYLRAQAMLECSLISEDNNHACLTFVHSHISFLITLYMQ